MNPYGINTTFQNIGGPTVSLNILYDEMPKTTGCEKCQEVNGEDAIWCCKQLNPSMYYVEFLNAWQEVQKWDKQERLNLIMRAIKNHLLGDIQTKGCIFWDKECLIYHQRPFYCRMYAAIPQDSWDAKVSNLKKRYGDDFNPRPQCNLVSVVDGGSITKAKEDKWFLHIKQCELRIGIPKPIAEAHDEPHGSYRTFHDHILLELFNEDFLTQLSMLRLSNMKEEELNIFMETLANALSQKGV